MDEPEVVPQPQLVVPMSDSPEDVATAGAANAALGVFGADYRWLLASAPNVHEVLAHPEHYAAWLKKVQEALNG